MTADSVRWRLDLVAGTVYVLLVPVLVLQMGVPAALRAALVLPFVLFVPGYAFLAAVYPEAYSEDETTRSSAHALLSNPLNAGIAPGERVLLSVVLSAAITPSVALVVNFSPFGIRPAPMFAGVAAVTVLCFVFAYARRARLRPEKRNGLAPGGRLGSLADHFAVHSPAFLDGDSSRPTTRTEVALNVLVAVALLSVLAGAAFAYTAPTADKQFTEFYLVAENDSGAYTVSAVPSGLDAGEERVLNPTITNDLEDAREYTVVVRLQRGTRTGGGFDAAGSRTLTTKTAQVASGETVRLSHTVGPLDSGEYRVVYLLYAGEVPAQPSRENADRSLRLYLTVQGGGSARMAGVN